DNGDHTFQRLSSLGLEIAPAIERNESPRHYARLFRQLGEIRIVSGIASRFKIAHDQDQAAEPFANIRRQITRSDAIGGELAGEPSEPGMRLIVECPPVVDSAIVAADDTA